MWTLDPEQPQLLSAVVQTFPSGPGSKRRDDWVVADVFVCALGSQLGTLHVVPLHSGFDVRPARPQEMSNDPLPAVLGHVQTPCGERQGFHDNTPITHSLLCFNAACAFFSNVFFKLMWLQSQNHCEWFGLNLNGLFVNNSWERGRLFHSVCDFPGVTDSFLSAANHHEGIRAVRLQEDWSSSSAADPGPQWRRHHAAAQPGDQPQRRASVILNYRKPVVKSDFN